jgi:3-oxoacyl-[acyl-carrier protein] reductase
MHLREAMDFKGKVALVTGGSGDIGSAIAKALAVAGADVAISYLGEAARAGEVVEALRVAGRRSHAVKLDQRDSKSIDECVRNVIGHFGRIDILVNNAGWNIGIPFSELDALTPEIWDRILETNLRGPFLLARGFAAELRRHKTGRVVNIASLAGIAPGGSSIAYAASKAALIHLTHCLAVALSPDVTVNCVAPGFVEGTRMAERVPEAMKQMVRAQSVLGRTGSVDDIAEMVVAYCRTDSVTGQTIVVDGGNPMGMH